MEGPELCVMRFISICGKERQREEDRRDETLWGVVRCDIIGHPDLPIGLLQSGAQNLMCEAFSIKHITESHTTITDSV